VKLRIRRYLLTAAVAMIYSTTDYGQSQPTTQRPFRVDDLFELEQMGEDYGGPFVFSPDGESLAVVRIRPSKTLANYTWEFLWRNAGADVWLQKPGSAALVNVTNGATDGSGWFAPQWSPDGKHLAMLSTRGGNLRLWVLDIQTAQLTQVSTHSIDLADSRTLPFLWVDSERLLVPVLPHDTDLPLDMRVETQTPNVASREWARMPRGTEATPSVLDSGIPIDLSERQQSRLIILAIGEQSETVVVEGRTGNWRISPDGAYIAFVRQVGLLAPQNNQPLPVYNTDISSIQLARSDGTAIELHGPVAIEVLPGSLRWSPDGREFSFLGYGDKQRKAAMLYRLDVKGSVVRPQSTPGLNLGSLGDAQGLQYLAPHTLVFRAGPLPDSEAVGLSPRWDWWLAGRSGNKCVTCRMVASPQSLLPTGNGESLIGVADDHVWALDAQGHTRDLTSRFTGKVDRLLETTSMYEPVRRGRNSKVIFFTDPNDSAPAFSLNVRSGEIRSVRWSPSPTAELVAYNAQTDSALFHASDRTGLRVWRVSADPNAGPAAIVDANQFLRGIAESEHKAIDYTSQNGQPLHGWILLPPGYQEGKRYPLVVMVYPGAVYRPSKRPSAGVTRSDALNPELLAGNGFAVLLPSMPLGARDAGDDPMLRLPDGVLPAVDKAVELGIADPQALFIMGQSFGGFAALGLTTQTDRFKAAITLAGMSNLTSLYGTFDARFRYEDFPHENIFSELLLESTQIHLGAPPWKDLGRYLRNSPITYVDRVRTPVLIVQGDMDYVPMQQGEEFFTSLYRQGKRARFVRYWGEGHVLQSPANIRDMWSRIFAWLEEFSPHHNGNPSDGQSP
jgi:dipeptidyl aminopeptidase/acylaminoacyl peptidase